MRKDLQLAWQHLADRFPPAEAPDPVAAFRAFMRVYGRARTWAPPSRWQIIPAADAPVPGEWIAADGAAPDRRILYLHGGAWIGGDPESHRELAIALSAASGFVVLMVDYRLAPEHPFPAGLDDAEAMIGWAWTHGPSGPTAANDLVLAGDSAGANLAAAACLRIGQANGRSPSRMALFCPVLDVTADAPRLATETSAGETAALADIMGLYAGAHPLDQQLLSPLMASRADLAQFPPTLIHASEADFLLPDAERFATRLGDVGVPVVLRRWRDLPHVWHLFLGLLPEATTAVREAADFLSASGDPAGT